ncbi:hypothetical protein IscW_ISCW002895 [Ixodes scapularis]|uniref:Uncharacterized protein n=1 Tax=Ixodes scapularis TaxID=6945 RepID=B7P7G3_IXOSC|nr:hypothetical protein IscW_ISCW002895 [Ixodes scapularis]|eukprot:XP_002399195.1 hypothetical protein IscW_ISCW002895 [Ixodes scapularis]
MYIPQISYLSGASGINFKSARSSHSCQIVQRVIDASKNMEVQPATSIDKSWCCIL